jgi:hypothetical protein
MKGGIIAAAFIARLPRPAQGGSAGRRHRQNAANAIVAHVHFAATLDGTSMSQQLRTISS